MGALKPSRTSGTHISFTATPHNKVLHPTAKTFLTPNHAARVSQPNRLHPQPRSYYPTKI